MKFTSFFVWFLVVCVGILCQRIAGSPVKQVNCEVQESPAAQQKCNVSKESNSCKIYINDSMSIGKDRWSIRRTNQADFYGDRNFESMHFSDAIFKLQFSAEFFLMVLFSATYKNSVYLSWKLLLETI